MVEKLKLKSIDTSIITVYIGSTIVLITIFNVN